AAFLELVGTPPEVAALTVDERVAEAGHVATGHPDLGVGDEGGVEADDIVALADHGAPPGLPDVPPEFDSKRAVVVGVREAAIEFGSGEHEPAPLRERDDRFEVRCWQRRILLM